MTTTPTECHPHSAPHQRTGGGAGRDCTRFAPEIPTARVIAPLPVPGVDTQPNARGLSSHGSRAFLE